MHSESAAALRTSWRVDPDHSTLGFTLSRLKVATVKSRFGSFAAALVADECRVLRASGLSTPRRSTPGMPARPADARAEFFDADVHPEIGFASRRIESLRDGELRVIGDLTIKDTTRPVELHGLNRHRHERPAGPPGHAHAQPLRPRHRVSRGPRRRRAAGWTSAP
jgi:polyisoprenoid-binding protein YceI